LAPKTVIASITEITAATIESTRHARFGTALEEGLKRTRTADGIPFTAEGHWFRADSTRPHEVRQGCSLVCMLHAHIANEYLDALHNIVRQHPCD
jgi:hypothetical protein